MTRIQFWILTALSSLIVLLLIAQIILGRLADSARYETSAAQQLLTEGQESQSILKQLAMRIYQDSQKTQDTALKELMVRQQISYNPSSEGTNNLETPASSTPPAR